MWGRWPILGMFIYGEGGVVKPCTGHDRADSVCFLHDGRLPRSST
jgi:hypothetical protein